MKVIKRDGQTVDFDRMKIVVAIQKANAAVEPEFRVSQEQIDAIADPWRPCTGPGCWWRTSRTW